MLLGPLVEPIVFKKRCKNHRTTFTGRPLNRKVTTKSSMSVKIRKNSKKSKKATRDFLHPPSRTSEKKSSFLTADLNSDSNSLAGEQTDGKKTIEEMTSQLNSPKIIEVDSDIESGSVSYLELEKLQKRQLKTEMSHPSPMKKKCVPRLLLGSSVMSRPYNPMSERTNTQPSSSSRILKNKNSKF
jgi:hypothetical protein